MLSVQNFDRGVVSFPFQCLAANDAPHANLVLVLDRAEKLLDPLDSVRSSALVEEAGLIQHKTESLIAQIDLVEDAVQSFRLFG